MRFPFRFMGILAVVVAGWIASYVYVHRSADPVTVGIEAVSVLCLVGFGAWVFFQLRRGAA